MKIVFTLVLPALITLFAGCSKKAIEYTIEGIVRDESFGSKAAGTTVGLYQFTPGTAGDPTFVTSAVTGADGKYSFTFKRDKVEKYQLVFSKDNYFSSTQEFTVEDLDVKIPKLFLTGIHAKAWVRLRFVNPDSNGSVKIVKTNGKSGCDECCSFSEFTLYPNVTDTSLYCINNGNSTYSYHWFRLQTSQNGEASVVTVPFDTTELVLNF